MIIEYYIPEFAFIFVQPRVLFYTLGTTRAVITVSLAATLKNVKHDMASCVPILFQWFILN